MDLISTGARECPTQGLWRPEKPVTVHTRFREDQPGLSLLESQVDKEAKDHHHAVKTGTLSKAKREALVGRAVFTNPTMHGWSCRGSTELPLPLLLVGVSLP